MVQALNECFLFGSIGIVLRKRKIKYNIVFLLTDFFQLYDNDGQNTSFENTKLSFYF